MKKMDLRFNKSKLVFLIILLAINLLIGKAFAQEPVPFDCTGQAFTVRYSPAELFAIDQSVSPFVFNVINLNGPLGNDGNVAQLDHDNNSLTPEIPIELNNLGFRSTDGMLYAMALKVFVPKAPAQNGNYGIVKIDSAGNIFPVAVPAPSPIPGIGNNAYRFPAGDVTPDGNTMYINAQVTSNANVANKTLYIVNLDTLGVTPKTKTWPGTLVNVADWAVNPNDSMLYGASYTGQIFKLDPTTSPNSTITSISAVGFLPSGSPGEPNDAYGGAWFNASGRFFAYRNVGEIYEIDLSGPTIINTQAGGPTSNFNDAAACAAEAAAADIHIEKTVCLGDYNNPCLQQNGVEVVVGEVGDPVTYFFIVTNTGSIDLNDISIEDTDLDVNRGDLTLLSGTEPLGIGQSLVFYYETTIVGDLIPNLACAVGITPDGFEVFDCDTANVVARTLTACAQGCTPGYWKNHLDAWVDYLPDESFEEVFGVNLNGKLNGLTLIEALNLRGNEKNSLIRHAVAALLNADSLEEYIYSEAEVITMVQCVFNVPNGCETKGEFELLKEEFEAQNQYCPLN